MTEAYHPHFCAQRDPTAPACIEAVSGRVTSYGTLDKQSSKIAQLLRSRGLHIGDALVILCENHAEYYSVIWAAQRAGLYFIPVSWHSTPDEIAYVLENSEAKAFIASASFAKKATEATRLFKKTLVLYSLNGVIEGMEQLSEASNAFTGEALPDETSGREMLYTSGTTGYPKAVKFPLTGNAIGSLPHGDVFYEAAGYGPGAVVLAPGPAYHASPLLATMAAHRFGAAVLVLDKFNAETCLSYIETYKVTHMICVPTHFLRFLKLPHEDRLKYDVSSLQWIVHTAAPCPVEIKRDMIEWVGPIITEIYSGTERIGGSIINSEEWLKKPGSIGRAAGNSAHVVDETNWTILKPGETGVIYFEGGEDFAYHGDVDKTRAIQSPQGWRTLGDIGHIDEEGYIFLTDRKSNMIISGGVNIYPQQIENRLLVHPKVMDAAVFGIPNVDFGEEVKAVVSLIPGQTAGEDLALELIAFCKETIMSMKCPRSIDFLDALPREANGKLYKSKLKERYITSGS